MAKNIRKFRHSECDIVEVDDDERAPRLPRDKKAERKRFKENEFWSDICWEDPLDDDSEPPSE